MHEVGLVEAIVAAVRRRSGNRPVAAVRVRIGSLHRVKRFSIEQAFELATADTPLEGAALELVEIPITSRCGTCGAEHVGDEMVPVCPECGGSAMDFEGGQDLILERVDFGVPQSAPVGSR
jgi:hydrogenase nickel incorporation protein HypA/HybF